MNQLPFRDINVHATLTQYAFTSPSSPSSQTLVVDRPSGNIRLNNETSLGKRIFSIAGILGIIKLRLDKYIIVVTRVEKAGILKGHSIYQVKATEVLPLRERTLYDQDEDTYLALLRNFLKLEPMYFSYTFDLTNTFQRQSQLDSSIPLWKRADDRFFWNKFVQTSLIDFRTSGNRQQPGQQPGVDPYILPVIYGMLRIVPTQIKSTPLTLVLITRKSRHMVGTRYFSRGIDEKGNASNFNETEQIVILNDSPSTLDGFGGEKNFKDRNIGDSRKELKILSYVQTRGSVPVFWTEVNNLFYTPKLQVRSVEAAVSAARAHFEEQVRLYGDIFLVNLVKHSGREQAIKDAYEKMVNLLTSKPVDVLGQDSFIDEKSRNVEPINYRQIMDHLHYIYFDYHTETKGLKLHKTQILLDRLAMVLEKQQYFYCVEVPGDKARLDVRNQQTNVFRTNCMDCLDRTNIVQSLLAKTVLNRQFRDLGVLNRHEDLTQFEDFEFLFRNLWADNADVVSKVYSGSGALKTDVTRIGKRTKAGMIQDLRNSIARYVTNNFLDGPRQDAFDLFMGKYLPGTDSDLIFIDKRPLLIQSIPYILAFSIFFVLIGLFSRRLPDAAAFPVKFFTFFWLVVGVWCSVFIMSHGMLYVNWPKLVPRPWAVEGYKEAFNNVLKDKVIGSLVTRHERGLSIARYTNAEEGKKRIE
ncbi:Phosphatidylinositol-3-phosphatase SAC1 [Erysiphe necator]|uniref:Putative phosphoinositide phosphatase n=1 Tax=Uncinula necator TaxID=52586 RepID=A0A0B1PB84_UNCNE|nr:Phosphatidylinositol-3-phosphatase SAC1 [Erysiphe necator]KHJ33909.1 putative phosphoinositide phosphatase [Erysiphe necator]